MRIVGAEAQGGMVLRNLLPPPPASEREHHRTRDQIRTPPSAITQPSTLSTHLPSRAKQLKCSVGNIICLHQFLSCRFLQKKEIKSGAGDLLCKVTAEQRAAGRDRVGMARQERIHAYR